MQQEPQAADLALDLVVGLGRVEHVPRGLLHAPRHHERRVVLRMQQLGVLHAFGVQVVDRYLSEPQLEAVFGGRPVGVAQLQV